MTKPTLHEAVFTESQRAVLWILAERLNEYGLRLVLNQAVQRYHFEKPKPAVHAIVLPSSNIFGWERFTFVCHGTGTFTFRGGTRFGLGSTIPADRVMDVLFCYEKSPDEYRRTGKGT